MYMVFLDFSAAWELPQIVTTRSILYEVHSIRISTSEMVCNYSFGQSMLSLVLLKEKKLLYVLVYDENPTLTLWTN